VVTQLTGYRRPDGRAGIRNHVVVLPVDDLSNAAAEGVARLVPGVIALPHAYGRLQFGEDLELTFRTLIGTGANPNVAAAVVIGIEPNWTNRVADGIAATGKPVARLSIEGHGDLETITEGARHAARLLQDAAEITREPIERSEVMISIKCGESDTTSGLGSCPTTAQVVDRHVAVGGTVLFGETTELTGGEHLIAARCPDEEVRKKFQAFFDNYLETVEAAGANLLGSQPTQGNIAGGLSTIEEKAMGNIAKTGTVPVVDALAPAEAPTRPGLNFMDTSSAAAECITLMAAAGAVLDGGGLDGPRNARYKMAIAPATRTVSTAMRSTPSTRSQCLRSRPSSKSARMMGNITAVSHQGRGFSPLDHLRRVCPIRPLSPGRLTSARRLAHEPAFSRPWSRRMPRSHRSRSPERRRS